MLILTSFNDLGLAAPLLQALQTEGYTSPTPIQAQAIPAILSGRDLLGIAQTGTGKTAAFALPMIQQLAASKRRPARGTCRALILSPTRELASQIAESFRAYGRNTQLSVSVVYGGVGYGPQIRDLNAGLDILVATPGRLLDHLQRRTLRLDQIEIFVLDEADQMLDLGFIHAIRRLVPLLPQKRQSLFFSATMPREIGSLADALLHDPLKVAVTPVATTVDTVDQRVLFIDQAHKQNLLTDLLRDPAFARTLIFTRTKHGADKVAKRLSESGIEATAIHGNKSQGQREKALAGFRSGHFRVMIATDIAARGIDVDGISHVVNFDLPNVPESYVHRIGRTARAGAAGSAIALVAPEERGLLRDIERLIRQAIPSEDRRRDRSQPMANTAHADGAHRPGRNGGGHKPGGFRQGRNKQQKRRHFGDRHGSRHSYAPAG